MHEGDVHGCRTWTGLQRSIYWAAEGLCVGLMHKSGCSRVCIGVPSLTKGIQAAAGQGAETLPGRGLQALSPLPPQVRGII